MTVLTPTVAATTRRWAFWAVFGVVAVIVGLIAFLGTGANRPLGVPLDPEGPGPAGAKAIVEVLRQQGVSVTVTESLEQTRSTLGADAATLVVHDRSGILDPQQLAAVSRLGEHLVLIDPDYAMLDEIAPEVAPAGSVDGDLEADCSVEAVTRAGVVTGDGVGYRYLGDDPSTEACLSSGDDVVSLVQVRDGDRTISVLGATTALSNERVKDEGNAAFALGLLGAHTDLVWYAPGIEDLPEESRANQLTPGWVTPVMVLLILVVIAAGVAQGRRMGPLVVENMPVTVRATETMEGRARLYQRSSARLRALDALRIGTVQRLASRVRLPRTAGVDEVAQVVAGIAGLPTPVVRGLLIDTIPGNDRELIELSDRLLELERTITEATTP